MGLTASLIVGSGLAAAAPAAADVAQQIRDTQARIDRLNIQAESAAERFNAGRLTLFRAQQRASLARSKLTRQEATVAALSRQVAAFAAQAYMSGSAEQGMAIVAGSRPDQVLGQLDVLDRIARNQAEVMAALATARHQQAAAAAAAQAAVEQTQTTVASLQGDKQAVETAATQTQKLLNGLQAKQAQLVQAARDAVTRRAAQARAAVLAEQARLAAAALASFRAQPVAVEQAVVSVAAPTSASAPVSIAATVSVVAPVAPAPPVGVAPPVSVAPAAPTPPVTMTPPVSAAPPVSSNAAQTAVQVARSELGKPYVWGAAGPDSFDCSGLTMYSYAAAGISLSHFTGAQWGAGRHVSESDLQPGDLVFFEQSLGHMGMYIGNGEFIHAPHTGDVVKISSLAGYWQSVYAGAVRVAG